ncbi:GNAT family N-acetyltransferase [Streptomyces antimicrobicus]|uniref:GNAT family N-acetyltransferase n=1 Tax=Streptomyces antimicrobicus TaxID=2883108 RepID=A0ABS8BBS7_9ACTN|nr:GNAT family N-acetyltransferase [Streptomyces antimicrobicus]MCB5182065.1 GNAT family N-acetyltransferase [Streptomyces antimicrobicus]
MLTVRPAGPDDAPAICDLMNAVDVLEIGRPETELAEVTGDLTDPATDLAHDSWLAFDGDRLIAYAVLWDGGAEAPAVAPGEDGGVVVEGDHYILPEAQEVGERLLELMERRALERARAAGGRHAVLHLGLNIAPTFDTARLAARGWSEVRRYHVMTRALSAADQAPPAVPGLTLRTCEAEADRRIAHALVQETMSEHFGHRHRSYEQWLNLLGTEAFDWSLVWIAALEGHGDVAVAVTRDNRAAMGWVSTLGVRKEHRGRGLGGHLLRHAFATYAARGRDTIGLGVDTLNASNALSLYESHGMAKHYAVVTWETRVHPAA